MGCSYYDIVENKDELPEMVDWGHEVKKVINATKDQEVVDNLTKKWFPSNSIPKDDKVDITSFYLPVVIPLFQRHGVFNHKNDTALLDKLHNAHPVISHWLHRNSSGRTLLPNFFNN